MSANFEIRMYAIIHCSRSKDVVLTMYMFTVKQIFIMLLHGPIQVIEPAMICFRDVELLLYIVRKSQSYDLKIIKELNK